ncbi:DUF4153 domain-containing protein [Peptoniphilus sp. KCTC 25270]|uniref:DUF4153 domain-containing protein n=1 Tax=Peptoniphilus sp. KCTC 25270 TaxID=2897414 RepID=UPI001E3B0B53|nr:DUF4153 domain-containing protein [Peptoniphilus sp. KCTC 25270]MCD1147573.1 DUF4153 domain-containing protein [Peptoniphilus sp. KCTC 25270]
MIQYIQRGLNSLGKALRLFPLSMLFIVLSTLCFLVGISAESKSAMVMGPIFLIGYFYSINAYLFIQKLDIEIKNRKLIIALIWVGCLILGVQAFGVLDRAGGIVPSYGILLHALLVMASLISIIVYIEKLGDDYGYPLHAIHRIISMLRSVVFGSVFFVALSFIIFTMSKVFDFEEYQYYSMAAIFSYIGMTGMYFLTRLNKRQILFGAEAFNHYLSIWLKYIFLPILFFYTVTMYFYMAEALFAGKLPSTEIVHLILWPQILAVILLFFTIHITNDKIIWRFRTFYPLVSLPLLGLMFYGIGIRIVQYGFTLNRYLTLALGIWVAMSMVHFLLNKEKYTMFISLAMTGLLLVAVLGGPVSAREMSFYSQSKRLENLLLEEGILSSGSIERKEGITLEKQEEITELLDYLTTNHNIGRISYLDDNFNLEDMKEVFGFNPSFRGDNVSPGDLSLSYSLSGRQSLNTEGYRRMIRMESDYMRVSIEEFVTTRKGGVLIIERIDENQKRTEFVQVDLNLVREKLSALYRSGEAISVDDLAIEGTSGSTRYKIYFTELYFPKGNQPVDGSETYSLLLLIS